MNSVLIADRSTPYDEFLLIESEGQILNILGMDPGKKGAFALIKNGKISVSQPYPLVGGEIDFLKLYKILMNLSISFDVVFIEKVRQIHGAASKSTFEFGRSYQMAVDAATLTKKAIHLVYPNAWQKVVFSGTTPIYKRGPKGVNKLDTKKMAQIVSNRIFPGHSFLATDRSSVPHDGMVDASLIAYYGFLQLTGENK